MRVIEQVTVVVDGVVVVVDRLEDGTFRRPQYLLDAERASKRLPYSGNALLRHGGDNTRPWMEEALEKGYHELPGDEPATEEARIWDGYGTAMKPAWEPVLVARKPEV